MPKTVSEWSIAGIGGVVTLANIIGWAWVLAGGLYQ